MFRDGEQTEDTSVPGEGDADSEHSVAQTSRCRHNYSSRTETGVNRQINLYMHAAYVYDSMVSKNCF